MNHHFVTGCISTKKKESKPSEEIKEEIKEKDFDYDNEMNEENEEEEKDIISSTVKFIEPDPNKKMTQKKLPIRLVQALLRVLAPLF